MALNNGHRTQASIFLGSSYCNGRCVRVRLIVPMPWETKKENEKMKLWLPRSGGGCKSSPNLPEQFSTQNFALIHFSQWRYIILVVLLVGVEIHYNIWCCLPLKHVVTSSPRLAIPWRITTHPEVTIYTWIIAPCLSPPLPSRILC